jgi:hypothetical protein
MTIEYITEYGSPNNLDDLFERGPGIGQNTGFYSAALAQDLGAMFAPRSSGQDIGFDTRFVALNGNDLRNLFAKKGTVVQLNWVGTITGIDVGVNQQYGYYKGYWGSLTTTSGGPAPDGFLYYGLGPDTTLQLPASYVFPSVTFTFGGVTLVMASQGSGTYMVAGDPFNILGQLNVPINASLSP